MEVKSYWKCNCDDDNMNFCTEEGNARCLDCGVIEEECTRAILVFIEPEEKSDPVWIGW